MISPKTENALPSVILLGDSIRIGYQKVAIRELQGKAEVWAPKDNCCHSKHTLANLDKWLAGKTPDIIHFNCGLHDMWVNEDGTLRYSLELYLETMGKVFAKLKELAPEATLVFALTTPVDQDNQKTSNYGRVVRNNKDIPRYNAAVEKLALDAGLLIDDLYTPVDKFGTTKLISGDGVHFKPEGCELLGKVVAERIVQILETGK